MSILTDATRDRHAQFLAEKARQADHRAGKNKHLFAKPPMTVKFHAFAQKEAVQDLNWVFMLANTLSMFSAFTYAIFLLGSHPYVFDFRTVLLALWILSAPIIFIFNIAINGVDTAPEPGLYEHEILGETIDEAVRTSRKNLHLSMLRDLTAAGYQIIAKHPESLAATTHRGVVTLVAEADTGELVYTVNGHPIRDTYHSLAEKHDAEGTTLTTINGATISALSPIFHHAKAKASGKTSRSLPWRS